jgi:hypothetical protein
VARDNRDSKRFPAFREERMQCDTGEGRVSRWRPAGCPEGMRLPCLGGLQQPRTVYLQQTDYGLFSLAPCRGDTPS